MPEIGKQVHPDFKIPEPEPKPWLPKWTDLMWLPFDGLFDGLRGKPDYKEADISKYFSYMIEEDAADLLVLIHKYPTHYVILWAYSLYYPHNAFNIYTRVLHPRFESAFNEIMYNLDSHLQLQMRYVKGF